MNANHDHPLAAMTRQGLRRRRPRHGIDTQPARCPICNQTMIVCMGIRGPRWLCGCPDHSNGNGTNGNRKA
jgi:hypothetical protein